MTPDELRAILKELKISRGGFGLLLGATRRSGENWTDPEKTKEVPGPVATIALMLKGAPFLLTHLEQIAAERDRRVAKRERRK